jgi:dTDP-4-dehydrorhamnose reductase
MTSPTTTATTTTTAAAARPLWLVGARGMLGTALRERIDGRAVLATDIELDIGDEAAVLAFARREQPGVILNAAAYTRVDDAEQKRDEAWRANADGPANLARAAREIGARLLHVSTDYVFDGRGAAPYAEDAPCAPATVYGASKRAGEEAVLAELAAGLSGYLVRTSWLFGDTGPSFVRTMVGLMRERPELKVVDDQHGRPTYAADLAGACLALVGLGPGLPARAAAPPGLYHFANTGAVSWHGFALGILAACRELGMDLRTERVLPVTTREFPRPAPRPAYSVLDTTRIERALGVIPRPWPEALRACLERQQQPGGASWS